MKQHKWHKEIKAWADGAEIETCKAGVWFENDYPQWHSSDYQFRIKPQPKKRISAKELIKQVVDEYNASCDKEPQYLYVSQGLDGWPTISFIDHQGCIGKIKLEVEDAM
jgi:hypothetical protein